MLPMRVSERLVHPLQARLVDGERLRTRERNACVALQSLLDDGTAALEHDELVEAHVHVDVQRFGFVGDVAFGEDLIAVGQADAQRLQESPRGAALRDAARSETLQNAAQIDGVENIGAAEPADDVAASLVLAEQALLREHRQRLAHRCARHAQQLRERRLRDARYGGEFAAQDHFADAYDRSGLMTVQWANPKRVQGVFLSGSQLSMNAAGSPVGAGWRDSYKARFWQQFLGLLRPSCSSKRDPASSRTRRLLPQPLRLVLVGAPDDVVTDRLDLLEVEDAREADHAPIPPGSLVHHARPGLAVRDQRAAAQVRQHRAAVGGVAMAAAAEACVLLRACGDLLRRAGCRGRVERGQRDGGLGWEPCARSQPKDEQSRHIADRSRNLGEDARGQRPYAAPARQP